MNKKELERWSSAITLSDMEIFIFPELMYGLVLANMMSPRIWAWRDDPWFAGLEKMKMPRRINRLKQFIMDHYVFNLDLATWGLTTKQRELQRFSDFIDSSTLAQSNALFGYEGDKYYFDIDIRSHFGLDKYNDDIIPYWKTETVEAMDAFRYKPSYNKGAGECVSLAALYAAALFIVAGVDLEDIFLMATPLHSQNFIDLKEGILTNNRRLVTKKMWFNGSALSAQARRALENERVTIVSHSSGYIHTLYETATIDPEQYDRFQAHLIGYLKAPLSVELLGNFLRHRRDFQHCFQLRYTLYGQDRYIGLERVFAYEHSSPYRLTDKTRLKLLDDIDREEFEAAPLPERIIFNEVESFTRENQVDLAKPEDRKALTEKFALECMDSTQAIEALGDFCRTQPRLPEIKQKKFVGCRLPLKVDIAWSRQDLIEHLKKLREDNILAQAAFYAYRDLTLIEPEAFVYAAVKRNPVCLKATESMDIDQVLSCLEGFDDSSIYDGLFRLAQPDEVWNYRRGDGLEKAFCLANILFREGENPDVSLVLKNQIATVAGLGGNWSFSTRKKLGEGEWDLKKWG